MIFTFLLFMLKNTNIGILYTYYFLDSCMFGKINYLFTGKTFNNITTFRLIRQFPRYNSNKMKLYTDKGNLQSLKIAAACFYNNESVDVKFVSKKGKIFILLLLVLIFIEKLLKE